MQTTFACAGAMPLDPLGDAVAIYHLSVKTISRSAGRSATAAAAYRCGVAITDERTGEIHDYRRKGGVESATLILPTDAPSWAADRGALWNAAEQAETRKNSTVAREFEIALPSELSPDARQRLAHDFARELVARHGCAADVAIHAPGKDGDHRNHHAHILLTTRRLGCDGLGEKARELDSAKTGSALIAQWRERFAVLQNERLQEAGLSVQVDHRSLQAQGIDRAATRHLGPSATGIERRTGQPSRKRQDYQQEAREQLDRTRARQALERQEKAVDQAIQETQQALVQAQKTKAKPRLQDLPLADQAKAWDAALHRTAAARQEKAHRVAVKAGERWSRRDQTLQRLRAERPVEPDGMLAMFKRKAYQEAAQAWGQAQAKAQKLADQAQELRLRTAAAIDQAQGWAYARLKEAHPELHQRVQAHKEAERRQKIAQAMAQRQAKKQERGRGMQR